MAIHSSTLAWKIPWTEEPDRLQCMGSQRVGHDWVTLLSLSPASRASPALFHPSRSSQSARLGSLCYTEASGKLSILHMIVNILSHSILSFGETLCLLCPQTHSLRLCLYFCPANRFLSQFSSVQSLSRVWLFETPCIAAHQAFLSITNSRNLLKLMSIELVMLTQNRFLKYHFSRFHIYVFIYNICFSLSDLLTLYNRV